MPDHPSTDSVAINVSDEPTAATHAAQNTSSSSAAATNTTTTTPPTSSSFPGLPASTVELTAPNGTQIVIVGTAHVSVDSAKEVEAAIKAVRPHVVLVELCRSRSQILTMDDKAPIPTLEQIIATAKTQGPFMAIYSWFLATVAADFETLPGGEFKAAFEAACRLCQNKRELRVVYGDTVDALGSGTFEAQLAACCRESECTLVLGDRLVSVTIRRLWAALSTYSKLYLLLSYLWMGLATSSQDLKDELDELINMPRDMLVETIKEADKQTPGLADALVYERDRWLAESMKRCAADPPTGFGGGVGGAGIGLKLGAPEPRRVVVVVGAGHVPGMLREWEKTAAGETENSEDIKKRLRALWMEPGKPPSKGAIILKRVVIVTTVVGVGGGALWLLGKGTMLLGRTAVRVGRAAWQRSMVPS